jgi:hypothetical protein
MDNPEIQRVIKCGFKLPLYIGGDIHSDFMHRSLQFRANWRSGDILHTRINSFYLNSDLFVALAVVDLKDILQNTM